ncbi:MAG: response regulator [Boseongicola sp.]|nr:response regulator [Boseongicola sp.]
MEDAGESDGTTRDRVPRASGETAGEEDASREAALTAAMLRIGASLDLDTVLREVVEGARVLTGAAYGAIATVDRAGAPRDFVTTGFTEEERRSMETWPDGIRLFDHLVSLATPLRLPDLDAWTRTVVRAPFPVPCGAFQATPMRHRDSAVGGFFLGGKDGGFTDADEAVLVLFAQQAAAALAHARAHHDEQRAKADLEALVETCPIGVAVFDATGRPLSFNREVRRILAVLEMADASPERLRELVVWRCGDGREVRLEDLTSVQTVRAEEIEISVSGGKSVRVLADATPIGSAGGAMDRVLVTLQDLAPFEALERARAQFLEMVSHELRAPLAAIRGSASTALEDPREPDRDELRQYLRIVEEQAGRMSGLIGDLLDAGRIGAGTLSVNLAPVELAGIVERARTAFAAGGGRNPVTIEVPEGLRVMADTRRVTQVLSNLFDNAARHSVETAPILVSAVRDGAQVAVSVTDGGEGVSPELLPHLFRRHEGAGRPGGSGLGLSICKGLVEAHGGRIRAESAGLARGTTITFTLPSVEETDTAPPEQPRRTGRTPVLLVDDDPHALRQSREALAAAGYDPVATAEPGNIPRLLETRRPALAILDLVLPGADGIELMRTLPGLADLPVIFVSAYGEGDTVARAIEAGAADYIVKPFSPAELAARVGLALRRQTPPAPFRIGELAFDRTKRRVTLAGRRLRLTATEYRLLHALSLDAGGVATYETLMRRVWGEKGGGNMEALRSAVAKLRRKLGDDAKKPRYVIGERGLGYRMPEPDQP